MDRPGRDPAGPHPYADCDLAALLLDCAAKDAWLRAAPAIARDEPNHMESSAEVVLEMLA